nr:reverse transcriptase domain-containing protein [Tanacetum cinerariifolium]
MRTHSSSNQVGETSTNPNPKGRNHRRSKQRVEPFSLEEAPVVTTTDQRTMAELLRAPTEGYAEEIVVPPILAEHFELKHSMGFFEFCRRWQSFRTNLLERSAQDILKIIENKSKVRNSRNKLIISQAKEKNVYSSEIASAVASAVTSAMTEMFKQHQVTPAPTSVKVVEESCVTCGGAHSYRRCRATHGNTFSVYQDNIQGYVSAAVMNYNQRNTSYRLQSMAIQFRPPGFAQPNVQNQEFKQNQGNNFNQGNTSYQAPIQQTQVVTSKLRSEMQSTMQNQNNAFKSELTNDIKNIMASFFLMNTTSTSGSGPLPSNTIANPKGELKAITTRSGIVLDGPSVPIPPLFINPEEDGREEETLTDPDLAEFTIKVPPPLNKLGLPELISTRMTLELANQSVCTPAGISRDVFVPIRRFTFPTDFVIIDYESDPRVPFILGRTFLRTARSLIDVYREELILCDGDKRLILNMKHDTPSYSNNPQRESIYMIDIYNISYEDYLEDFTTSSSPSLTTSKISDYSLEEFADEPALIESFRSRNDDINPKDVIKKIEYLLNHDPLAEYPPNNDPIYTILEMFTDEHTLDYSSLPRYDDTNDDLFDLKTDNDEWGKILYDDPFDSKENKIKDSKLLIDELDSPGPSSFLPLFLESDSVLYEDFFVVDTLTSTDNEDKISSSNASLILEDYNPPVYDHELPFHIEIPRTSQSRQHVDTSLIHFESRKSPTAKLIDVDSGRISIHHIRLKIHIKCACLAIRVTWARPIGMKGFAMWDWGHRVTWGVGGVNGTVQVRESAQEKDVGVMGFLARNSVVG